jgi:multisubunit Na+/H+ antiporter MnhB subunit
VHKGLSTVLILLGLRRDPGARVMSKRAKVLWTIAWLIGTLLVFAAISLVEQHV